MSVLSIDSITSTSRGLMVAGRYDPGAFKVLAVRVGYRYAEQNGGSVSNATDSGNGIIRIESNDHRLQTGDEVTVSGIRGTVEANGTWKIRPVTEDLFDLKGTGFVNPYTSGGGWVISHPLERDVRVEGNPPPTNWTREIVLNRRGIYEVRAWLFWNGTPSFVTTDRQTVSWV